VKRLVRRSLGEGGSAASLSPGCRQSLAADDTSAAKIRRKTPVRCSPFGSGFVIIGPVNSASQNLTLHLGVLQEKLQHATDYELALTYFLEEFAGDAAFHQRSEPEPAPHLLALLGRVTARALGAPASLEQFRAFRLAEFGFHHGAAKVADRAVVFLFFESVDTGLMALIPGIKGQMEVARFRLALGHDKTFANN